MAEFTKAMEAIQQLAETQRQLAAAQASLQAAGKALHEAGVPNEAWVAPPPAIPPAGPEAFVHVYALPDGIRCLAQQLAAKQSALDCAYQQIADTNVKLLNAQERAEQVEASCAVLRGLALDARYYLVYGSRNFDAIQAVIDRINAALSADNPGAALLADARALTAALKLVEPPAIEPWEHDDDEIYIDASHHLPVRVLKSIQAALRIAKKRRWDKEDKHDV